MKRLRLTILLISTALIFSSCDFITNAFTYKDTTQGFVESLLKEDYDKSLTYMATEHEGFKNLKLDTLKGNLAKMRTLIVNNFGDDLEFQTIKINKTFSTIEGESTEPNTTLVQIEFYNDKEFGVFEIVFDDTSNKILNINALDVKRPIPSIVGFWLFGLLAISIPIFNIWIIRKIKKSKLEKKWPKYIAVILLNAPSLTYNAVHGLSFGLLSFQFLLGLSFSFMGFLGSAWTLGIPLGGLYWLWKLSKKHIDKADLETEIVDLE